MVIELTQEQDGLLRDTWRQQGGWTPGRDGVRVPTFSTFPTNVVALERYNDSAEGITKHQLDVFMAELKNGHRCVTCASPEDVFEVGLCGDCLIAEEN
jgi:hypothetical protein